MNRIRILGFSLIFGLLAAPAFAGQIIASAVESSALDADGHNFDYTLTLTNTAASTDVIGTFWFAWVPGSDFMVNQPISLASPAGWLGRVTHGPPLPNGFAIQWVANTTGDALAIGSSLTFGLVSAETPEQLADNSVQFPTSPEMTSVLYNGRPFSADSETIVVATASPEPPTWGLSVLGIIGLVVYGKLRR